MDSAAVIYADSPWNCLVVKGSQRFAHVLLFKCKFHSCGLVNEVSTSSKHRTSKGGNAWYVNTKLSRWCVFVNILYTAYYRLHVSTISIFKLLNIYITPSRLIAENASRATGDILKHHGQPMDNMVELAEGLNRFVDFVGSSSKPFVIGHSITSKTFILLFCHFKTFYEIWYIFS